MAGTDDAGSSAGSEDHDVPEAGTAADQEDPLADGVKLGTVAEGVKELAGRVDGAEVRAPRPREDVGPRESSITVR